MIIEKTGKTKKIGAFTQKSGGEERSEKTCRGREEHQQQPEEVRVHGDEQPAVGLCSRGGWRTVMSSSGEAAVKKKLDPREKEKNL